MKQSNDSMLMHNAKSDLKKYGYSDVYNTLSKKEADNVIENLKKEFPNVFINYTTCIIYEK